MCCRTWQHECTRHTTRVDALGGAKQQCSPLIGLPRNFILPALNVLLLKPCRDTTWFWLTAELIFMAKRRAEDTLLHDSPSKRRCRSLYSGDMQLHSVARAGGVSLSPPRSLMALLGSRCRKRPYYFEDPEKQGEGEAVGATACFYYKATQCDTRKHAADVLTVQTSGSFQERRSCSILTNDKKRQREDCVCPNTAVTKANEVVRYWLKSRSRSVNSRSVHRKWIV